jgi:hypothetical protein
MWPFRKPEQQPTTPAPEPLDEGWDAPAVPTKCEIDYVRYRGRWLSIRQAIIRGIIVPHPEDGTFHLPEPQRFHREDR